MFAPEPAPDWPPRASCCPSASVRELFEEPLELLVAVFGARPPRGYEMGGEWLGDRFIVLLLPLLPYESDAWWCGERGLLRVNGP